MGLGPAIDGCLAHAEMVAHGQDVAPEVIRQLKKSLSILVDCRHGLSRCQGCPEPAQGDGLGHGLRVDLGADVYGSAQDGMEFPHIPGPAILHENGDGTIAQIMPAGAQEMACQGYHVDPSGTQRRERYHHTGQSLEQVMAQPSGVHLPLEVVQSGGNDAETHMTPLRVAQTANVATLEHPEQFGLALERKAQELVEEKRPPIGLHDETALVAYRPGKCPSPVAEQLSLDQITRYSAAVDVHQLTRPGGQAMNLLGEQLLARPGLSHQ